MTHQAHHEEKSLFGFWVYLMTDCVLFGGLFATFAVLSRSTFGGPGASELFSLPFVFAETSLLLISSYTCGLAMLALGAQKVQQMLVWLLATFALGAGFLSMEIHEFSKLVHEGNGPQRSGFLSAFFTLVGTHGLHITIGLFWLGILMVFLYERGLTPTLQKRLKLFSLFWHFLDIVWIFLFTIVYLAGVSL